MILSLNKLSGSLSAWLLGRPSARPINEASLRLAALISVALVMVLLIFSFIQWRTFQDFYQSALGRERELLEDAGKIQDMSTFLCNAHRATLSALLAADDLELASAIQNRTSFMEQYRKARNAQSNRRGAKERDDVSSSPVLRAMDKYDEESQKLVRMVQEGNRSRALEFRLSTVRPTFDSWQMEHDRWVIEQLRDNAQRQKDFLGQSQKIQMIYGAFLVVPIGFSLVGLIAFFAFLGLGGRSSGDFHGTDPWRRT